MAELVGGAFLSAALQVAFEKLASSEIFDFFRRRNLDETLLKKLHIILISVNQVIEDAEELQYRNTNVKKWLDELKDAVFKAEDIIDEIDTEASQQKLQAESQSIITKKLKGCYRMTKLPSNFHKLMNLCHLDMEGSGIKKTPGNMGKLRYLGTSTEIVVKDNRGSNLRELGDKKYLGGRLIISELENISDPVDVKEANIKDMHFDKLELKWGMANRNGGVSHQQEYIILLDALQPNCGIVKVVNVEGYGGTRFSDWMNGLDFVVSLKLINCRSCDRLPPLGQLPLLEELEIGGFDGIKVIGHSFRRLGELYIRDCPKLRKSLPQQLPRLNWLSIKGCTNLETWDGNMATCSKETYTSSGVSMILEDCPHLTFLSSLCSLIVGGFPKLIASWKDWGVHNLLSFEAIQVCDDDIENVESFPAAPNLRFLEFRYCSKLKAINYMALRDLQSLRSLIFGGCPLMSFENFPDDEQAFPISLSELCIWGNCPLLKERCEKEKGQDWSKVSHIPLISID
ncbi:putative disease resistance RPP13-like protein 1 [Senna tora]|uniref:Putative disease resistance RPP13-like protein 1 n=1 Tax=Senna tora TaxID=362788 RepID=A0A834TPQ6_9FABA|nr:putative disease resistance RPP13-like protein 1 [Senna tora]